MCEFEPCRGSPLADPNLTDTQRRRFLAGTLTLPLVAILADSKLLHAQAAKGEMIRLASGDQAYLARAQDPNAPVVILIHEWWGLNDHIKAMAQDISTHGFHGLAIDLFDGSVATTREQAMAQTRALKPPQAHQTIAAWVSWARENGNGKIATLGWCFGGGWSLQTALNHPIDGAVIYYGRLNATPEQLANLSTPLMGHFGTLDQSINPTMVGQFEKQLRDADKQEWMTSYWYTANHAFANPTGGRYDEDDANLAWARTHTFLASHLL
ncbi:MAG: dienelactone hydrolase family protein [Pseudomonadota bacterium]